jgi:hypothetical protein
MLLMGARFVFASFIYLSRFKVCALHFPVGFIVIRWVLTEAKICTDFGLK